MLRRASIRSGEPSCDSVPGPTYPTTAPFALLRAVALRPAREHEVSEAALLLGPRARRHGHMLELARERSLSVVYYACERDGLLTHEIPTLTP